MKPFYFLVFIVMALSFGINMVINKYPDIFNSKIGLVGIIIAFLIDAFCSGTTVAIVILKYKK